MATFIGMCTSNTVKVNPMAIKYLQDFLNNHGYADIDYRLAEGNGGEFWHLSFYGQETFLIRSIDANGEPDYDSDITKEFLKELSGYLLPGEKLVIQSIGYEKLRFPLCAYEYIVRNGEPIKLNGFDTHEC